MNNRLNVNEAQYLRHYPSTDHLDKYRTAPNPKLNKNKSTVLLNASSNINLMSQSYMPKTAMSTFASHKSGTDLYRDDPNPYKISDIEEYRIRVHDPFVPKSFHHRSQQVLTQYSDDTESPYAEGNGTEERADFFTQESMFQKYRDDDDHIYPGSHVVQRSQTLKSTSGVSHKSTSTSAGRSHLTGRSSRVSGSVSISSTCEDEFEIPEPDYEGSTAGSSEDIPLPLPESSCSEEYSSVSAASDPDQYNHHATEDIEHRTPGVDEQDDDDRAGADSGLDTQTKITSEDRTKIEYALKGRLTSVYVALSLANLYVMRKSVVGFAKPQMTANDWVLKYTGVPVLLLDSGETKSRDKRRIQIVLAELGSGLALWKDVIDNLTSYKVLQDSKTFHYFHYSQDHSKIIGLSFDDEEGAVNFALKVEKLTSDFANISLSGAKSKKNKKDAKAANSAAKPAKFVRPKKSEISQPCCFQHVSSLSSNDKGRLSSLNNFILNSDNDVETCIYVSENLSSRPKSVVGALGNEDSYF